MNHFNLNEMRGLVIYAQMSVVALGIQAPDIVIQISFGLSRTVLDS
jgi:hypothetical protein